MGTLFFCQNIVSLLTALNFILHVTFTKGSVTCISQAFFLHIFIIIILDWCPK